MRWLLLLLGGCDYVLGLEEHATANPYESMTHDEDLDGIVDALDLCPHVPVHTDIDNDRDGIANDCDPRPDSKDDRHFFAFENGNTTRLATAGTVVTEADAVLIGGVGDNHASLVFAGLDIDTSNISVAMDFDRTGYEEKVAGVAYSEVRVHSVHRGFGDDNKLRGDTCFAGIDGNGPNNATTNFLEIKQDDMNLGGRQEYAPPLAMTSATIVQERSPGQLSCSVVRDGQARLSNSQLFPTPRTITGTVAISAVHITARVHYLWIVTPRL